MELEMQAQESKRKDQDQKKENEKKKEKKEKTGKGVRQLLDVWSRWAGGTKPEGVPGEKAGLGENGGVRVCGG